MFKRMMSLLLALVLVAGLLPPVRIHAEEAEEIPETVAVETAAPETEAAAEAEETAPAETEPLQKRNPCRPKPKRPSLKSWRQTESFPLLRPLMPTPVSAVQI